jgi:hypothetical protein
VASDTPAQPDCHIRLSGTLDPKDPKKMVLTYDLTVDDRYSDDGQKYVFIKSGCTGQVLLREGVPVTVSRGGKRSFRLKVARKEKG